MTNHFLKAKTRNFAAYAVVPPANIADYLDRPLWVVNSNCAVARASKSALFPRAHTRPALSRIGWTVGALRFARDGLPTSDLPSQCTTSTPLLSIFLSEATFKASENVLIGNTCLYGATGGAMFVNGRAGERFAVRNSMADTVVEVWLRRGRA